MESLSNASASRVSRTAIDAESAAQAARYNRAVTHFLNSINHGQVLLQRADYILNQTYGRWSKRQLDALGDHPSYANVIVRDQVKRLAVAKADANANGDTGPRRRPSDMSSSSATAGGPVDDYGDEDDRIKAEALLLQELEDGGAPKAKYALMAARDLACDPTVDSPVAHFAASHKSAAAVCFDNATQTVKMLSDSDVDNIAAQRAQNAIAAAVSAVDRLEKYIYGLADRLLHEHRNVMLWAKSVAKRAADSGLPIPPMPEDLQTVILGEDEAKELLWRRGCDTEREHHLMAAADRDANAAEGTRVLEQSCQTLPPPQRTIAAQTVPLQDSLAKFSRKQHELIEEMLVHVKNSSNGLWGWECKPNPLKTFVTTSELTEMLDYDNTQLHYLLDSVRRAPLARDVALAAGVDNKASGPDVASGSSASSDTQTEPLRMFAFDTQRDAVLQVETAKRDVIIGVNLANECVEDRCASPMSLDSQVADYFNAAVAAKVDGWRWRGDGNVDGDRTPTPSAPPTPQEDMLPLSSVARLTEAAVVVVQLEAVIEVEQHKRLLIALEANAEHTAMTTRVTGNGRQLRLAGQVSSLQRVVAEQAATIASASAETAALQSKCERFAEQLRRLGFDENDPDSQSLDVKAYQRMVADLEARQADLKRELEAERARVVASASHSVNASKRSVAVGVAPRCATVATSAVCTMASRASQADPNPSPAPEPQAGLEPMPLRQPMRSMKTAVISDSDNPEVHEVARPSLVDATTSPTSNAFEPLDSSRLSLRVATSTQTDDSGPLGERHRTTEDVGCDAMAHADAKVTVSIACATDPRPEVHHRCVGSEGQHFSLASSETQCHIVEVSSCAVHAVAVTCDESVQVDELRFTPREPPAVNVAGLVVDDDTQTAAIPMVDSSCGGRQIVLQDSASTCAGGVPVAGTTQTVLHTASVGVTAAVQSYDFGHVFGNSVPHTASVGSYAFPSGSAIGVQCNYQVGQRTRATETDTVARSDVDCQVALSDDRDLFAAASMSMPSNNGEAAELLDRLATRSLSVLGRKGRAMSAMFLDMRRRVLEDEETEAAADTKSSASGTGSRPDSPLMVQASPTVTLAELRVQRAAATAAVHCDTANQTDPISLPRTSDTQADDRPTPSSITTTVNTKSEQVDAGTQSSARIRYEVPTQSRGSSPVGAAADAVLTADIACQADEEGGGSLSGLPPGTAGRMRRTMDIIARDIRSSYTRGNTGGSSSHLQLGLTGTHPETPTAGLPRVIEALSALEAAEIAATLADLQPVAVAQIREALDEDTSADRRLMSYFDDDEPRRTSAVDEMQQKQMESKALFDWRRVGVQRGTMGSSPTRLATRSVDSALPRTQLAFGSHVTPHSLAAPLPAVDVTPVVAALTPAAKASSGNRTAAQLIAAASRTPEARQHAPRTGGGSLRPKQPVLDDPIKVFQQSDWAAHERNKSAFTDDCMRKTKAGVKLNAHAFELAAHSPAMQRSSEHVVKAVGVVSPSLRAPHRLRPLPAVPEGDAVVHYTPTYFDDDGPQGTTPSGQ